MVRKALMLPALLVLAALSTPGEARPIAPDQEPLIGDDSGSQSALPYIQCVPYARMVSGIRIYGDAHTWWEQAAGRYARGTRPKVNAVMSFRPFGAMQLGHVAVVSKIVDKRTVLLRHANWSLIGGRRGQMEDNVRAVDVSASNDWSEVRVWFAPLGDLGTTHWPLNGFIYNIAPGARERVAVLTSVESTRKPALGSRIGADFLDGIEPEIPVKRAQHRQANRLSPTVRDVAPGTQDPIGQIILSRLRQGPPPPV